MFAQSPWFFLSKRAATLALIVLCAAAVCSAATVNIQPGDNIPSIVASNPAGTTFVIYPGTYRLQAHIVPKTGDSFVGQTACAPPASKCPAILSGSKVIGSLATFNGTNYQVTGQTQQGEVSLSNSVCVPGYLACNLPEDLFFDGVPYQHLYANSLPAIGAGQWWFDYATHTIYFHDNPAGHTVETSVLDTAFDSLANNVTIQYLTVEEFANPLLRAGIEPTVGNASSSWSLNWVIKDCELLNNHGGGVRVAFGTQVYNSYIHNNGTIGISGGTASTTPSGIIIQGNTINNNNYANMLPATGSGGIKLGDTANAVVRGNTISNNGGAGIHFDTSSANPLVDGNIVTGNYGGNGFGFEISLQSATVRNNVFLNNALAGPVPAASAAVGSYASTGLNAYCNVVEVPNVAGTVGMIVMGSDRGYNANPPYQYLTSTGNDFHHNTVIWESGANATVGYALNDAAHQPNFFADNTPPDNNTYHLPSLSDANFVYDNNDTQDNTSKTFSEYQAAGADIHGSADTNNTSGYPTVTITSPADQSSVTSPVTIAATASDASGISKVEFYVDWNLQETVTSSPYSFDWTGASAGTHTVAAMAYSNAGIRSCYAATLNAQ
jgi:parallel beta-helix repeat protein